MLEIVGGALLALRLFIVPVALILTATMAVAIGASGLGHGDVIPSLTLAPALLGAMVFLARDRSQIRLRESTLPSPIQIAHTGSDVADRPASQTRERRAACPTVVREAGNLQPVASHVGRGFSGSSFVSAVWPG